MANDLAFFYQLQGANFNDFNNRSFKLGVVDADESALTRDQLSQLNAAGKQVFSYISAGEAEVFRDYWRDNGWGTTQPDFFVEMNPRWGTSFRVKFWDPDWQQVVIERMTDLIQMGYKGAYFDVIDVYNVPAVQAAYAAAFPAGNIREAMVDFIVRLSATAKALNPDFQIMAQNAVGLLNTVDIGSLSQVLSPNTRYLNAIDGLGKESTFTYGDDYPISWGPWDAKYVENAVNASKYVIGLEYPTLGNTGAMNAAYNGALAAGYIPYLANELHDGQFVNYALNYSTLGAINASQLNQISQDSTLTPLIGGLTTSDLLIGNQWGDSILGHGGNDVAYGLEGDDIIRGMDGDDQLLGWYGNDTIEGGNGVDSIYGDFGADLLDGGAGNDYIFGWSENDTIHGGAGNDAIWGDAGADSVNAGAGNDVFFGSTGNDTVYGGAGNDEIFGDEDDDQLYGEGDNDRLYGWTGNDTLDGGAGDDSMSGDQGNDSINAGSGNDWVYAGDGDDRVQMGAGNDWAFGDVGNDSIDGGDGDDVIFAWEGNDTLIGGTGNDFFSGEGGNDSLIGGAGNDELYGGAGADRFVYSVASGIDTIRDFVQGTDVVVLSGFGVGATFASVIAPNVFYAGGNATISFGAGHSLNIDGVADGSLNAGHFVFV